MGRKQSWDNAWDVGAMSNYNTITSLSESPVQEGLLYAGTDDGYIAVSADGGGNWNRIPVTRLGLPARSFVNDIKADLHDANTVYVVLDNHKEGDYNPYLFKSTDRGQTWTSLSRTLPERTLLWRIVQDHIRPSLMFLATEFGVYTTLDGGANWQKLPGTPNMGFRDLAIQKRENDLVAASFGRGFYILDDYSALRQMTPEALSAKGKLFAPRAAKWYVPRSNLGNTGADFYLAKNPEFGAVFTYHLSDGYSSTKQARQKAEKEADKRGADIPFPGYDAIDAENSEQPARVWLTIRDNQGNVIRNLDQKAEKGTHRLAWDLRHASTRAIDPDRSSGGGGRFGRGPLATPGSYTATLSLEQDGQVTPLGEAVPFQVTPIHEGTLKGMDYASYNAYREELATFQRELEELQDAFDQAEDALKGFKMALERTPAAPAALAADVATLEKALHALAIKTEGSPAREEIGERNPPSIQSHFSVAFRGLTTTYGPTALHKRSLGIARAMLAEAAPEVQRISGQLVPALAQKFEDAGAPYIKGMD